MGRFACLDGGAHGLSVYELYCRWIYKNTNFYCAALTTAFLVACAIVVLAGFFELQDFSFDDWSIPESKGSIDNDAFEDAKERTDLALAAANAVTPTRSEAISFIALRFLYQWSDPTRTDQFFTPENAKLICEIESVVKTLQGYRSLCLTDDPQGENTTCAFDELAFSSQFYTQDQLGDCPLLDNSTFQANLTAMLARPLGLYFASNGFTLSNPISIATRSEITFAGPLANDTSGVTQSFGAVIDTNTGPQYDIYEKFYTELEQRLFDYFGIEYKLFRSGYRIGAVTIGDNDEIMVRYDSNVLSGIETDRLVNSDQLLASASAMFVGTCMYLHLRSFYFTITGIFLIVGSVPVGLFIYRAILQITYFNNIHIITIFIVLGIGADVVYVFVDTWKQSLYLWGDTRKLSTTRELEQLNPYGTGNLKDEFLIARLSYTLKRATFTIFNTSSTTAVAFFATGISPVIPVSFFGIFAGFSIISLFLFSVTFMPVLVIQHHRWFEGRRACCPCILDDEPPKYKEIDPDIPSEDQEADHTRTLEERIFVNYYIPLFNIEINGFKVVAIVSSISLVVFMAIMLQFALDLSPPSELEETFSEPHMFLGFAEPYLNEFLGGSDTDFIQADMVFGISGIDRTGFKRYEPTKNRGSAIFDPDFALAPSTNQQFILDTCQFLRNISCDLEGCTGEEFLIYPDKVTCRLEEFIEYHNQTFNESSFVVGDANETLFNSRLFDFTAANNYNDEFGFIDGKPVYISIQYTATLKAFSAFQIKTPVMELFDEVLEEIQEQAPAGFQNILQVAFDFVWRYTEVGIINGLFLGLVVSLSAAFIVLLYGTNNIFLAPLATFAIVSIVSITLAVAKLSGFNLGIAESIAGVMSVGLSVDYTIHISSAWVFAAQEGHRTRSDRFAFSAERMGPTVIAAAVTTAGSGAVLFATQLAFFGKMALLIVATISFSAIYALFFFLPVCLVIGPEDDFGEWRKYFCKDQSSMAKFEGGDATGKPQLGSPATSMTDI